jgi:hypothetical protein
MLKQDQLKNQYEQLLRDCFSRISKEEVVLEPRQNQTNADVSVDLLIDDKKKHLLIELKSLGTPKSIQDAVNQLLVILNKVPNAYGIVIAPYISRRSAKICKEADIGYIDLSGNFWIRFDSVFLSQENMPNQYPFETRLTNIYAPKSERVLRVLLTFPFKIWKTTELAEEANISLGMITHIRRRLEEETWVQNQEVGFYLSNPDALIHDWVNHYEFQNHERYDFYTMESLSAAEKRVNKICEEAKVLSALTGFSAATRLAPMVKGQRSTIFIGRDIFPIAKEAGLKSVESGANISLIKPYDSGVFWNRARSGDVQIATPIQVYLDLRQMRGRSDEAAEFLFTEVIQTLWQHQKKNMNQP